MQDINGVLKTHRVNRPPGITAVRRHDLEYAGGPHTFEGLGRRVGLALLPSKERMSDVDSDRAGERPQSLSDVPIQRTGFNSPPVIIPVYLYLYTTCTDEWRLQYGL